jgi:hypothetical protein
MLFAVCLKGFYCSAVLRSRLNERRCERGDVLLILLGPILIRFGLAYLLHRSRNRF